MPPFPQSRRRQLLFEELEERLVLSSPAPTIGTLGIQPNLVTEGDTVHLAAEAVDDSGLTSDVARNRSAVLSLIRPTGAR